MSGRGRFQWNIGGWFGSQLGGTVWMLVGAAVLASQAPWIAAWWVACFLAASAVGIGLWLRRDRIRPYPALQALLATCGLAGLLAIVGLHLFGPDDLQLLVRWHQGRVMMENPPGDTLPYIYAILLLGIPALMGYFALIEWSGTRGGDTSG